MKIRAIPYSERNKVAWSQATQEERDAAIGRWATNLCYALLGTLVVISSGMFMYFLGAVAYWSYRVLGVENPVAGGWFILLPLMLAIGLLCRFYGRLRDWLTRSLKS
jgi:hypothetical protein